MTPLQPLRLERVLLATNWSEGSEALHEFAARVAANFDAEIVVVTAFDPPAPLRIKRGAPGQDEYRRELEEEARETAAEVAAELVNLGLRARAVIAEGPAADVILEQAEAERADLIILMAGGQPGARDYFLGTTTERVTRHATVPVLVYKRPAG